MLSKVEDARRGKTTSYEYDADGNLTGISETGDSSGSVDAYSKFTYEKSKPGSPVSSATFRIDASTPAEITNSYAYLGNGNISSLTVNGVAAYNVTVDYGYDTLDRLSTKSYYYSTGSSSFFENTISYEYLTTSDRTSTLVSKYTTQVGANTKAYEYTYDDMGNITAIKVNGTEKYRYYYDEKNQLIREDNIPLNKTIVYNYDSAGNITSKKTYSLTAAGSTPSGTVQTKSYTYGDSTWGDKLTAYNGTSITYDGIGNPTYYAYDHKTLRLAQLHK